MKKKYIIISIIVIALIAISVVLFIVFQKGKTEEIIKTNSNITIDNNVANQIENVLPDAYGFGPDERDEKIKGFTDKELEEMISNFYGSYKNSNVKEIVLGYNEKQEFTATVSDDKGIIAEYIFDTVTGYAEDKYSGLTIDFINGKIVNQIKDKELIFKDGQTVAIGYVDNNNETEFINKYVNGKNAYNSLTIYDMRTQQKGEENKYAKKLVIIPKDETVKISLYDCIIDNNGKVKPKDVLIDKISEPFILTFDDFETTTPRFCLKIQVGEYENTFPILFSGESNKLDVLEYSIDVLDISIYK